MTRPNVLWIMADELRADALSCYGTPHPAIATPNIDRIAAAGVLFERAYTTSPVCVPARQAMLSGVSPLVSGILNNEGYAPDGFEPPIMFTEVLADAGWATRSYGKEHLPGQRSPWQVDDHTGTSMASLRTVAGDQNVEVVRSPGIGHVISAVLPEGVEVGGEQITRSVIKELQNADGPLLVRASYLQPHKPMVVPEPWASKYDDVVFDAPRSPEANENVFEREWGRLTRGADLTDDHLQLSFRRYHGSVAWLDEQVGMILDALEASGRSESTIVVFTTDHGASLGEYGILAKHTFSPESHRVPLIVSWPGRLPAGERRADLAASEDVAVTVLGLTGQPVPASMTGRHLFESSAPEFVLSAIGYGEPSSRAFPNRDAGGWTDGRGWPQRVCLRTTRYRLDLTTRRGGDRVDPADADVFLADGVVDPTESRNVADDPAYRDVRDRLTRLTIDAAARIPSAAERPEDFAALRAGFADGGDSGRHDDG
jgi:choline-sulfatase